MVRKNNKNKVVVLPRPKKKKTTKTVTQKELTILGQALRSMGGIAGGAIGTMFGAPGAGSNAGSSLGASLSRWLGSGDYSVSQNSIVSSVKASGSIPMMHMNDQTIIVRHKEFLCEVLSNTAFTVNRSFRVNPGSRTTFPWLNRIASSYQQYRIKGMVYHYVPSSGSLSSGTSNALGTVMLQTSYRSNDSPPTTKVELLNEYWSSESVPSEPFCHPIECNPSENPFNVQYVRSDGTLPPSGDSPLLYDLALTHVATSGQQAAGVALGDLWVSYEIELKKPIISSNVTSDLLYGYYRNASSPTFADPFGTGAAVVGNLPFTTTTSRTIVLPAQTFGEFWIGVYFVTSGTYTNFVCAAAPVVTNCSYVALTPASMYYGAAVAGTNNVNQYNVRVVKTQRETAATVQIPLPTGSGGTASVEVTIIATPTLEL